MNGKQYVFLVHGTWGYVKEEDRKKDALPWYEEGSHFAQKLLETLRTASPELEWEIKSFTWPNCGNIDAHRDAAADALEKTIRALRNSDPEAVLHFIAHSHGGNIVLDAVGRWMCSLYRTGQRAFYDGLWQLSQKTRDDVSFKDPPTADQFLGYVNDALKRSDLSGLSRGNFLSEPCQIPARNPLSWNSYSVRYWHLEVIACLTFPIL